MTKSRLQLRFQIWMLHLCQFFHTAPNRDSFNQFIEGYEDYHGYGGIAKFIHHECLYNTNFREGDYSDVSLLTKYGFSCHGLENNESNECITTAYNQICSTSNHDDL